LRSKDDFVTYAVECNGIALLYADPKYLRSRHLALRSVWDWPSTLRYLPKEFANDPEFVRAAIKGLPCIITDLDPKFSKTLEFAKMVAEANPACMFRLDTKFHSLPCMARYAVLGKVHTPHADSVEFTEEEVLNAIIDDPYRYKYLPTRFKKLRAVVLAAARANYENSRIEELPRWVSEEAGGLLADEEVVRALLHHDPNYSRWLISRYTTPEIEKTTIVAAFGTRKFWKPRENDAAEITDSSHILKMRHAVVIMEEFQSHHLADREIALAVVEYEGTFLKYFGKKFRSDMEIGTAAIRSNPCAAQYISSKLLRNPKFFYAWLRFDAKEIFKTYPQYHDDPYINLIAIESTPGMVPRLSQKLLGNPKFVKEAIVRVLQRLSVELQDRQDKCLA
jgi:hypothetical protein